MSNKFLLKFLISFLAICYLQPLSAQEYNQKFDGWSLFGGSALKSCVLFGTNSSGSRVSAFATGGRNEITFAVSNAAWRNLSDGKMRLQALFLDSNGEALDYWSLDSVGENPEVETPAIRFTIDRASNDGESFVRNFRQSGALIFAVNEVPIAKFDLKGSSRAMDSLLECRAFLRSQPDFDPFAG